MRQKPIKLLLALLLAERMQSLSHTCYMATCVVVKCIQRSREPRLRSFNIRRDVCDAG